MKAFAERFTPKTFEAFSTKLRDETDLETLSGELVEVVGETIQPAHVSVWLRPDTVRSRTEAAENRAYKMTAYHE